MTAEEVADLWATAHRVAPAVRAAFEGDALTFAVQDGAAAGQTVPHVHVHILPRVAGDFARNDEVYDELDAADMARPPGGRGAVDADEHRKPRSKEAMAAESAMLRKLFADFSLPIPPDGGGRGGG
jgi:bis(5'-adenosyl)-triphosphatase